MKPEERIATLEKLRTALTVRASDASAPIDGLAFEGVDRIAEGESYEAVMDDLLAREARESKARRARMEQMRATGRYAAF